MYVMQYRAKTTEIRVELMPLPIVYRPNDTTQTTIAQLDSSGGATSVIYPLSLFSGDPGSQPRSHNRQSGTDRP